MKLEIYDNSIKLSGYPFYNFFNNKRKFFHYEIDFINLDADPILFCVQKKEILFLERKYEKDLKLFAEKFNIDTSNKIDVWELICFPFTIEAVSPEAIAENESILRDLSFYRDEIADIRNRVSGFMKSWAMFTMEGVSLTHYDVLLARKRILFFNPLFKKFYWYTMKIALKGYSNLP